MKKKNKNAVIWLVSIAAIFAGIFGIYKLANPPAGGIGGGAASAILAFKPDDWFKGNQNAKTVLIEYSDFQCPACASLVPVLEGLNEEFGSDLKIIYRHFPLFNIHPNAILASQAAEAAGRQGLAVDEQGKFWEMHSILFENQQEWSDSAKAKDIFKQYAVLIGLDQEKFIKDLDSEEVKQAVRDDLKEAQKLKLSYTPTLILNGKKIKTPRSYDQFRALISQAIAESKN